MNVFARPRGSKSKSWPGQNSARKTGRSIDFFDSEKSAWLRRLFSENHKNNIESVIIQFPNILYFIDQNYVKSVT